MTTDATVGELKNSPPAASGGLSHAAADLEANNSASTLEPAAAQHNNDRGEGAASLGAATEANPRTTSTTTSSSTTTTSSSSSTSSSTSSASRRGSSNSNNSKPAGAKVMQRGQSVLNFNNMYRDAGDAFVEPDVEFASELSRHRMFEEGRADPCCTSTEDFSSLGYGLALYFQFLKMLIGCFLMVGVLTLPILIFCSSGEALEENFDSGGALVRTTLGNIGSGVDCADNSTLVQHLVSVALGSASGSGTSTPAAAEPESECVGRVGFWFDIPVALSDVMFVVSSLDALASLAVLLCSFQFIVKLAAFRQEVDRQHLTAADYAVEVRGLPRNAKKAEILQHFSDLYDLSRTTSYTFRGWCGCLCRRKPQHVQGYAARRLKYQPVRDTSLNTLEGEEMRAQYCGKWVAEVSLVLGNGNIIRQFLNTEALLIKVQRFRAKVSKLRHDMRTTAGQVNEQDYRLKQALEELSKLEARLRKTTASLDKQRKHLSGAEAATGAGRLGKSTEGNAWRGASAVEPSSGTFASASIEATEGHDDAMERTNGAVAPSLLSTHYHKASDDAPQCLGAFVIFNNRESFERCIYDYKPSRPTCCRRCQPPPLRFRNRHPLKVTRAPEPSTVIWENMDTSNCERCCRRTVSFVVTLVLLFVVAFVFAVGQAQRKRFSTQCFDSNVCEFELPATYYQDYFFNGSIALGYSPETASVPTTEILLGTEAETLACQAATRVPTTQYVTFGGMNRTEVNEFYFGDMAAAVILLDGADSAASQARNWTTLVEAGYYANVTGNGPFFPASPLTGDALSSECLGPCVDFSVTSIDGDYESTLDPNCPTAACAPYSAVSPLTCSQYAKSSCVANCYCWAQLRQLGEELGYIQALWQMVGADGAQSNSSDAGLCSDVVLAVARNSGLMWGAVIALASVNIIMTVILKRLSRFERYSNAGEENRANLLKIFFSRFLNSAIVVSVVAADGFPVTGVGSKRKIVDESTDIELHTFTSDLFAALGLFNGGYVDMTREWYSAVGGALLLTLIANLLTPVFTMTFSIAFRSFRICLCKSHAVTQHDLDTLYQRPQLPIDTRYAHLLTVLFLSLFYSSGLPLMIPLATVCFVVIFAFDKCLILRFYSEENASRFDGQLALTAANVMPWAVILHLVIGVWTLGSPGVTYTTSWPPGEGTLLARFFSGTESGAVLSEAFVELSAQAEQFFESDPFEWDYCVQYAVFNNFSSECLETARVDGLVRRIMRVDVLILVIFLVLCGALMILRATMFPLLARMARAMCGGYLNCACCCHGVSIGGELHLELRKTLSAPDSGDSPTKNIDGVVVGGGSEDGGDAHDAHDGDGITPALMANNIARGQEMMDIVQLVNAIHYPAFTAVYSADVSHLSPEELERRKLAFGTNVGWERRKALRVVISVDVKLYETKEGCVDNREGEAVATLPADSVACLDREADNYTDPFAAAEKVLQSHKEQVGTDSGRIDNSDAYAFKVLWPVVGWFHMTKLNDAATSVEDSNSETPSDSSVAAELGRQLENKGGSRMLIRRCSRHEQKRWRKSVRHSVAMRVESLPEQKVGKSRATSKVHPVSTLSALDGTHGGASSETPHPQNSSVEDDFLKTQNANDEDECVLLMKLWPRAGTIDALFHDRLDPKFTWQVIAETGGFSYNIWKHTKYKIALRGSVGEAQRLRAVEVDRSQDPQVRAYSALEKQRAKDKTVTFAGPRQRSAIGIDLGAVRHETNDNIVAVLSGDGQHVLHFYDSRTGETVENLDSEVGVARPESKTGPDALPELGQDSFPLASSVALALPGTKPSEQGKLSNPSDSATPNVVPHALAREQSHHKLGGVDADEDHHDRHLWEAMHKRSFAMHPPLPDSAMSGDGDQTWTTLHDPNRRHGAYFLNVATGKAQFDPPEAMAELSPAPFGQRQDLPTSLGHGPTAPSPRKVVPLALHGMWQQTYSIEHRRCFYYHKLSGKSCWETPSDWWAAGDVDERFQAWAPVVHTTTKTCIGYYDTDGQEFRVGANNIPQASLRPGLTTRRISLQSFSPLAEEGCVDAPQVKLVWEALDAAIQNLRMLRRMSSGGAPPGTSSETAADEVGELEVAVPRSKVRFWRKVQTATATGSPVTSYIWKNK